MAPDAFLLWSGNHSPEVYVANSLLSVWRRLCVSVKVAGRTRASTQTPTIYGTASLAMLCNVGTPKAPTSKPSYPTWPPTSVTSVP